ncbi:MAG: A/G-specific adenine glycosylase [Candidatus Woesearchaeota archaeon]|nr:A/G-specific adenine glycosylase [Candidatus Woesearchaeota archaeon]
MINKLLTWYKENGRHELPWRKTRNPYKVLVSELMLQQTQVPRVIPKYKAFLKQFPTLKKLAQAERADVLRAWQGLGYNSRAARFHALAKAITKLPETREELLQLPGIGPYTAGAIMIFAHNKPAASVDVNVERVIKRLCWKQTQQPSKQEVEQKALELIQASNNPHDWHSMLMDFGSTICKRTPSCLKCPVRSQCKSKGKRADETTKKQPKFKGSTRYYRGQLLKKLLEKPLEEKDITKEEKEALRALIKEKLVTKQASVYHIH